MTEQIITLDSLAYAEIKTIQNANELVEEAKLLFENKKYSRTWALSHLAIEEISKTVVFLFAGVTICNGIELKWKELDRFLRSHQSKLKTYFMLNEEFNDFSGMIDNVNALNKLKNRSFYVDLIDDKMYKPSDFFDKGQAKIIINVAKRYLESHQKDIGYKGQIKDNHQKEIVKHYWNMHKRMTVKEVGEINYIAVIDEIIKDGKTYNKFKEIIKYMGD